MSWRINIRIDGDNLLVENINGWIRTSYIYTLKVNKCEMRLYIRSMIYREELSLRKYTLNFLRHVLFSVINFS